MFEFRYCVMGAVRFVVRYRAVVLQPEVRAAPRASPLVANFHANMRHGDNECTTHGLTEDYSQTTHTHNH